MSTALQHASELSLFRVFCSLLVTAWPSGSSLASNGCGVAFQHVNMQQPAFAPASNMDLPFGCSSHYDIIDFDQMQNGSISRQA